MFGGRAGQRVTESWRARIQIEFANFRRWLKGPGGALCGGDEAGIDVV